MPETELLVQSERQATELLQVHQAGLVERVQGSRGIRKFSTRHAVPEENAQDALDQTDVSREVRFSFLIGQHQGHGVRRFGLANPD